MSKAIYDPSLFEVDGSLRDVYVADVGIPEWDRLLFSLAGSGWEYSLTLEPPQSVTGLLAAEIFECLASDEDASARLAIRAGPVWFTCHFFEVSEIEFSFDPTEIVGPAEFEALHEFMTWLAKVCNKRVIMTMETTDHVGIPALLDVIPGSST